MRQNKMLVLGITGGVGAGKTTILRRLKDQYGAHIIQADKVGHYLMEPQGDCYEAVINLLGKEILGEKGVIDRKKVAAIVFSDDKLLMGLNQIIHPGVKKFITEEIEQKREEGCKFFAMEAALLLEEHYDEICDDLWYIYVDDKIRRDRLKAQRGYSDEVIDGIVEKQLPDGAFRARCKYVVENNGDLDVTYSQIDKRVRSYEIM